jgi:hypothetical protein
VEVRIVKFGKQHYLFDLATGELLDVWRTDGKPIDYNSAHTHFAALKLAVALDNE